MGGCPGVLRAPLLPNPPLSPGASTSATPTSHRTVDSTLCSPPQPAHRRGRLGPSLWRAGSCPLSPGLPASPPCGSPLTGLSATRPGHALTYPALATGAPPLQGPFPPPAPALSAWPSSRLPDPWGLGSLKPADRCPGCQPPLPWAPAWPPRVCFLSIWFVSLCPASSRVPKGMASAWPAWPLELRKPWPGAATLRRPPGGSTCHFLSFSCYTIAKRLPGKCVSFRILVSC